MIGMRMMKIYIMTCNVVTRKREENKKIEREMKSIKRWRKE